MGNRICVWMVSAAVAGAAGGGSARAQTAPLADLEHPLAASTPAASSAQADAGRHGSSSFLGDVWRDYRNFVTVDTAKSLATGATFAFAIHPADEALKNNLQDATVLTTSTLAGGQQYGGSAVQFPLAIGWWAVGAAAGSRREADAGRDLVRAQISVTSWTYAFKYAASRTRPNGDPRSFPSGHSSAAFATASVLQTHYGWKVGLPAFAAATYTGASRLADNKHWASDVVFGAVLGIVSARTVTASFRATRFAFQPFAAPHEGGVTVIASR